MRGNRCRLALVMVTAALLAGCQGNKTADAQEREETSEQKESFLAGFETAAEYSVETVYAEKEEYPELAAFLISYYQIPQEYLSETRYYYNYIDLDDDGTDEIFAFVVGEYTEVPFGDPALILQKDEAGGFTVLEAFEGVHTPITISKNTTNGWHDIIYNEYGRGAEDGYRICHYNPDGGYQTEINELLENMPMQDGTQILSNNLIDDMDKGNYLTLAPCLEE